VPFIEPYWNALLVHPLISLLVWAYDFIADFGFAVVLVTLLIRLALYPLYVTQIRSQRAMQELAPAIKDLQQKHGKDKARIQQEQMKLYQERGINPLGGCLPLLLQMPILFAMYAAFVQAPILDGEQLRQAVWSFIPLPAGVGPTDHLDMTAHWLPWITSCEQNGAALHGLACPDHLFGITGILPIVAGLLQLVASLQAMPANQPKSTDPNVRMTQTMAYYFPLITVYFASTFPSGLAVYWVTTTVFQIVQQYFVSGWGQLVKYLPFLSAIPTPADRLMAQHERAAIREVEADMAGNGAEAQTDAVPGDLESNARRKRRRRRGR
jgi:YidC/Oxa1 family membrane protein insertase